MTLYLWNDTDRRLAYCASELGEKLVLNEAAQTVTTTKAYDGTVVLAAGTSKTAAKTHMLPVDKTITSAP